MKIVMITMKGKKKKHFGLIVMKLHMNVFGMCSCALMIEYFKMATIAMITVKVCQNLWPHLYRKPPKGFPQNLAYILRRVGRIFWPKKIASELFNCLINGRWQNRQNFNVLWFQWKFISKVILKWGIDW